MSLTSHTASKTPEPSLSAFSQPPPTPSSQATNHASIDFSNTSSILFTFLVVFLAFFGTFMLVGIFCHRLILLRRRVIREELENVRQIRLKKHRPEMWDAWANQSLSPEEAHWAEITPLSLQHKVTRPRNRIPRAQRAARSAATPTNAQLLTDAIHDFVCHGTLSSSSCSNAAEADATAPAPPPSSGASVRVAVLVAMPSPRHREISADGKGASESEQLPEYVIGVAQTRIA